MFVKRLQKEEILDGLHLVWEVFAETTAPSYPPQGVHEFQQFIRLDNIMPNVLAGELTFWGAYENMELCGVAAVQNDGHMSLLFVRTQWQKHGAAKMLFAQVYQYCTAERGLMRITANASPESAVAYRHLGFRDTAAAQTVNGIMFIPMERMVSPGDVRPVRAEKPKKGWIIGVSVTAAILVLLILFGILFVKLVGRVSEHRTTDGDKNHTQEYREEKPGDSGENGQEEQQPQEEQGIEVIPCYEAEALPYTIEEETYTYISDGSNAEYPMEFDIRYPQIKGLQSDKLEDINTMLKECAMSTADTLYLNPSEGLKEAMLQEETPFLASQVTYKVTYAGADFISVAFSDHYFSGSYYAEFQDLRTRNIGLSDGTRYETADIVDLSDDFMKDWLSRMKGESPNSYMLAGLKMSQFRQVLGGEILDNKYYDNFFVDAEGIEIGMTYHYSSDESIERGWITAPFTLKELETYKKDGEFWKIVQYTK